MWRCRGRRLRDFLGQLPSHCLAVQLVRPSRCCAVGDSLRHGDRHTASGARKAGGACRSVAFGLRRRTAAVVLARRCPDHHARSPIESVTPKSHAAEAVSADAPAYARPLVATECCQGRRRRWPDARLRHRHAPEDTRAIGGRDRGAKVR